TDIIIAQRERCKTLKEMAERSRYFYEEIKTYDEAAMKKHFSAETAELLHQLVDALTALSDWSAAAIHQVIIAISERLNVKLGQVAQPIRIAMTGSTISPPIDITLQLIGKDRSINRLMKAINYTKAL
ncbi:MAG TPA: glutamate--tRNA ligase, partial [Coxiellaceae bacterium]|nr:glutamate--tRNA ligase [Coxiellaceae bacterium]